MKNLTALGGVMLAAAFLPATLMATPSLNDGDFETGIPNNIDYWAQSSSTPVPLTGVFDPNATSNLCARFGTTHYEHGVIHQNLYDIDTALTSIDYDIYIDSAEYCGGNYDLFGVTVFNLTTGAVAAGRVYELCSGNNSSAWESHSLTIPATGNAAHDDLRVEFWISTDYSVVSTVYLDEISVN